LRSFKREEGEQNEKKADKPYEPEQVDYAEKGRFQDDKDTKTAVLIFCV